MNFKLENVHIIVKLFWTPVFANNTASLIVPNIVLSIYIAKIYFSDMVFKLGEGNIIRVNRNRFMNNYNVFNF